MCGLSFLLPANTMPACTVGLQSRRTQKIGVLPANIVHTQETPWAAVCASLLICVCIHLCLAACTALSFVIVSVAQTNLTSHLHLFNLNMNAAVRALKEYIHQIRSQHCMRGSGMRLSVTLCVLETCVRPSVCLSGPPFSCPRFVLILFRPGYQILHLLRERTISAQADRSRRPQVYDLNSNCTPPIHFIFKPPSRLHFCSPALTKSPLTSLIWILFQLNTKSRFALQVSSRVWTL